MWLENVEAPLIFVSKRWLKRGLRREEKKGPKCTKRAASEAVCLSGPMFARADPSRSSLALANLQVRLNQHDSDQPARATLGPLERIPSKGQLA